MDPLLLKNLNSVRSNRKACVVVTNLEDGRGRLVMEGDRVEGELGQEILQSMRSGKSATTTISGTEYFLNAYLPAPRIVVIGAVHISQAMAQMSVAAGYSMEVVDPRTAFATRERFPSVGLYPDWPEDVFKENPLDPYCALAAVTHDPKIDDFAIKTALDAGCFYVGALGSRKTHGKRLERLGEQGVTSGQMDVIKAPIGLDIGAASPEEIAVSIMAEIIAEYRKRGLGKE